MLGLDWYPNRLIICVCVFFFWQVEITKLKLDKDRKKILDRKAKPKQTEKGKHKDVQQPMDTTASS